MVIETTSVGSLGERVQVERVCFSSIIKRDDRPELNLKTMDIKEALKRLCLEKGSDFIGYSNIGFRHLAKDRLHMNRKWSTYSYP